VYADALSLDTFRERLKANLGSAGDFVVVNYDRRVLKQSGAEHISPVGAYDEAQDAFLVLDEAAYKYPFTCHKPNSRLALPPRTASRCAADRASTRARQPFMSPMLWG